MQRLVFLVVPLTGFFTLLIAGTFGLAVTRSITQPLARLVEGSKALARGDFQHTVPVTGSDELADLGRVFNDTARRLQDLYATLQQSEDRLRLVIDTIPAHVWSTRPDGSVDFINQRFLEFTGRSVADIPGWDWRSLLHSNDLMRYVGEWQAAIVTGEPMESEARVRRMDGEYRWLLIRNVPLRDERGNIVKWYATSIDIEERHRAEDALRRSEDYLAEAQRLSHTGSLGWKPSTGQLIWSEETFRIFQYDRNTTPTVERVLQRVHPEDAALVQQTVERATQDEKDFDHEHRLMMPDGSLKHLHVVARALNNELGAVEFVGAVMDVTERKRAAEALLRGEAYLAEGQKLSHTGTWACNLATREMIHSSEEHRHLFGLVPERVGIPPFEEFYQRIHPDDQGPTVRDLERAMTAGTDIEAHFRVVLPEGTTRYMYGTGHPLAKPSGETGEFVGTVMDVTAAKLAEQTLRESEAYLAEAQRLSHTGSWARIYATGETRYFSEECYRVLGFEPLGGPPRFETFLQRVHPDDQAKVREITERAGREKVEYELDYRIVHPAGEIRDVHVVAHPVFNPTGDLVEFVGSVMDITERRQAEEALRQAQADLARINRVTTMGELTASLAHEVNQPIAAAATDANTCLRWLARDQPDLEEARAAASRVVKDAARAGEIMAESAHSSRRKFCNESRLM